MDDIIKLIDLSMEDGLLDKEDYNIILKKAKAAGISEEELNLIISKRAKVSEGKTPNLFSSQRSNSYMPYLFGLLAILFTFFDWVHYYSKSTVMGSSGGLNQSFNGWFGGYGAPILFLLSIGCFLYYKSNRFYWVPGIIALFNAIYVYSSITNSDVSMSYNYGGYGASAEAGFDLAWGFWAFIASSSLFTISGLLAKKSRDDEKNGGLFHTFKENVKSGWKPMILAALLSSIVLAVFFADSEPLFFRISLAIASFLVFQLLTLVLFLFVPSSKFAGYVLVSLSIIGVVAAFILLPEGAKFIEISIMLLVFPAALIALGFLFTKPIKHDHLKNGAAIMLVAFSLFSCGNPTNNQTLSTVSHSISGTYSNNEGGVELSLTIMGSTWFGTHVETSFGNVISSSSGQVIEDKIYDEYGTKLGYITNGKAYVNIGGYDMILYKE